MWKLKRDWQKATFIWRDLCSVLFEQLLGCLDTLKLDYEMTFSLGAILMQHLFLTWCDTLVDELGQVPWIQPSREGQPGLVGPVCPMQQGTSLQTWLCLLPLDWGWSPWVELGFHMSILRAWEQMPVRNECTCTTSVTSSHNDNLVCRAFFGNRTWEDSPATFLSWSLWYYVIKQWLWCIYKTSLSTHSPKEPRMSLAPYS